MKQTSYLKSYWLGWTKEHCSNLEVNNTVFMLLLLPTLISDSECAKFYVYNIYVESFHIVVYICVCLCGCVCVYMCVLNVQWNSLILINFLYRYLLENFHSFLFALWRWIFLILFLCFSMLKIDILLLLLCSMFSLVVLFNFISQLHISGIIK